MKGISCTHFYIKRSHYSSCKTSQSQTLGTVDLWSDVIVPLAGLVSLNSIAEKATKVSILGFSLNLQFSDQDFRP
jgi:hypothetical protein